MLDTQALLNDYGPYALVTGSSSGIGQAMAQQLAKAGFHLVLVARRLDRLQTMADQLHRDYGVTVKAVEADVGSVAELDQLLDATRDLDIGLVISNAGFSVKGEFTDVNRDLMLEMIRVNCDAPLTLAHGFIPRLKKRARSGLIFTSSIEALIGCPYSTAYSASKALVKNLGEGLWAELKGDGVDVLTLCPGATDTEGLSKNGFDASKMPNVMTSDEVAIGTLANIKNGPIFISSEHYKKMFEQLTAMPRDQALLAMAKSIKA